MEVDLKIAIIGLGYVGLPLAVEFGKKFPAVGYDINTTRISELQSGKDVTLETSPSEMAEAVFLGFTSDALELKQCNVFIITVPTPIDGSNSPDLSPVISATHLVAGYLKKGDVVVYESTVYPGATEEVCVPILEKVSGLTFNNDFYCGY
ncbi:MAG: NAD(P)-binding domain-containing protein, partial [Gammaproteobacteria bacterium]